MASRPDLPPETHSDIKPGRRAKAHGMGRAALAVSLVAATAWLGRTLSKPPEDLTLPPAVFGERREIGSEVGRLSYYVAGPAAEGSASRQPPLLLIHSINAAGTAYEVKPVYERFRTERTVYALELPGFGFSERSARLYTPRIMTDAILAMVEEIGRRHDGVPVDALAVSLSCEFLARAAVERPGGFRSLALVSPTGFDRSGPRDGPPGSNRGMPKLYGALARRPWSHGLFELLTSRISIRYFLEKTWGSKHIDEGLLNYDYLTTHQPGAEHAPYSFIGGFLFSKDTDRLYGSLQVPVWMVHGTRGDFVDYSRKGIVEGRPNWTMDVLDTGALPHFERTDEFLARYDGFLAGTALDGKSSR